MAEGAISMVVPIMPLFIKTLGTFSQSTINLLAGVSFSITFLIKAFASPIWGKISDRIGHKPMLLRASGGLTVCCFLVGIAPNVSVVILARAIQGIFSGYINNAEAMLASQVPLNQSGHALGSLSTGDTAGLLCGPIIVGVLATIIGYRGTFIIAALLMLSVFILSWLFVDETFVRPSNTGNQNDGIIPTLTTQTVLPAILAVFLITLIIQSTNNAVNPIISLYLPTLLGNSSHLVLMSGIVSALPGIATVISASFLGNYGDHHSQIKLLSVGLITGIILYIPQIFVSNIIIFSILRFLTGFSIAALLPAAQSLLTHFTQPAALGRVFSYNQTFQALGNVLGAMLSTSFASLFGYSSIFVVVILLEIIGIFLIHPLKNSVYSGFARDPEQKLKVNLNHKSSL